MPAEPPDRSAGHSCLGRLQRVAANGQLRSRRTLAPDAAPHVRSGDRSCINFCSNDYLGLAADGRIAEAFKAGLDRYGVGAGASQYVSGYRDIHAELEQALAEFTGYRRTLVFSSGYLANLGAITALCDRQTDIYLDRLAHASLIDAAILSRARMHRFAHNDVGALAERCSGDGRPLVATEGVFSMEGDCADLPALAELCRSRQALLYLDDAHGFGVQGEQGRGSLEHHGLSSADVPVMMATFGKALGVAGAFVAGPDEVIESVLQRARSLIYTTAMPPAQAAAVLRSLVIVRDEPWRRDKLQELVAHWREGAGRLGLPVRESQTAIQPLMIGDNDRAVAISEALLERGFLASAIRPPTVPEGSARLRITLTAAHEKRDIDRLLSAMRELL